ncbi:MAG: D-alanyl-D-alanine carboxypeptidase family protein [Oscillospiraceae bacterium]
MLKLIRIISMAILSAALMCNTVQISKAQTTKSTEISAKSYVIMESLTGKVIDSKNMNDKLPIASTTKILTSLIALEQPNLYEYFEVDKNAIMVEGSSMGLQAGDKVTLEALVYGMLLPSGNDAANAAATRIAGSCEKFSLLMNERAKKIGMNNSSFTTPSGLDADIHFSTAYDMALLARQAIKNENFVNICKMQNATVTFGNPMQRRRLTNHNKLLSLYDECFGIKTGFTKKAGRCLVGAAQNDGVTLVCVTLNAPNDWQDQKTLFDYGFANTPKTLIEAQLENISLNVVGGTQKKIELEALSKPTAPIEKSKLDKLTSNIIADKFYYAPIKKGELVGQIEHVLDGNIVAVTDLVAAADIPINKNAKAKTFLEKIRDFLKTILK